MFCRECGHEMGEVAICPKCDNVAAPDEPKKESFLEEKILWGPAKPSGLRDRLKLFFNTTRYTITNHRIATKTGLLKVREKETDLRYVEDMDSEQGLWARMLGVGTVSIRTKDPNVGERTIHLRNIKGREEAKKILRSACIKYRQEMRVMMADGASCNNCD